MIRTIQQNQSLRREAIAELACQLWRGEGRPRGRDQEYWLRAERLLLQLSQPEDHRIEHGVGATTNPSRRKRPGADK